MDTIDVRLINGPAKDNIATVPPIGKKKDVINIHGARGYEYLRYKIIESFDGQYYGICIEAGVPSLRPNEEIVVLSNPKKENEG